MMKSSRLVSENVNEVFFLDHGVPISSGVTNHYEQIVAMDTRAMAHQNVLPESWLCSAGARNRNASCGNKGTRSIPSRKGILCYRNSKYFFH